MTNGAHVNGSSKNGTVDKHSDKGSELSETSDLDGLDDDEDGDGAMNLGSDDEEEKKSQWASELVRLRACNIGK